MQRSFLVRGHAAAGALAMALIALFLCATLLAEAFGTHDMLAATKQAILTALLLLIPLLMLAALSGRSLAGHARGGIIGAKQRRMMVIAALGALVLLPCAVVLANWAATQRLGPWFAAVQGIELAAGATNLTLLWRNFRDGRRMRQPRRQRG